VQLVPDEADEPGKTLRTQALHHAQTAQPRADDHDMLRVLLRVRAHGVRIAVSGLPG